MSKTKIIKIRIAKNKCPYNVSRFVAKPSIFIEKDAYASSNEVATSSGGFCGNRSKQVNNLFSILVSECNKVK